MRRIVLFLLFFVTREYVSAQSDFPLPLLADKRQASYPSIESRPLLPASGSLNKDNKNDLGVLCISLSRLFLQGYVGYGFITPGSYRTIGYFYRVIRNSDNTIATGGLVKEARALGLGSGSVVIWAIFTVIGYS